MDRCRAYRINNMVGLIGSYFSLGFSVRVRLIYGIFIVFSQLNLFITMLLQVTTRPETATMEGNKKCPLHTHTQKVFQL